MEPRDRSTSPTFDVVGPDLDAGAGVKGRQQSRREETLMCGGRGHPELEEGGWGGGPATTRQLAASLINATAANVAHPFDDIMVAVVQLRFKHLQVAHFEARGRKWHLGKGQLQLGMWYSSHSCSPLGSPAVLPYFISKCLNNWILETARGHRGSEGSSKSLLNRKAYPRITSNHLG